jgi:hypothetical protein
VGVVLACLLGGTLAAASAVGRPKQPIPTFTAIDARTGHVLPQDPLLRRAQRVIVTVCGFAPHTPVRVALVRVRFYGAVRADRRGYVVFRFTVPRTLRNGRQVLIFSGLPRAAQRPAPRRHPASRTRDPQVVAVTVPFDPPWPFRLGGAPPPHPPSTAPPSTAPPTTAPPSHATGGEHGGTSFTGADVAGLVFVAVLLLAVGVALSYARRRRR